MIIPSLKKRRLEVMIAILLVVIPILAFAQECLSPSPSITVMGQTPYVPIKVRKLTSPEFQDLSKLFHALDGEWHGTSEEFFCRSNRNPLDIDIKQATIRADVKVDRNSNLKLSANLYSESDRTNYQRNLWLYLNNNQLRLNNDNGTGDIQLQTVSNSKVAFFARHVLQSGTSGGSGRKEPFYTITKTADGFDIEMRLYVQGKLSSGYTWKLSKTR